MPSPNTIVMKIEYVSNLHFVDGVSGRSRECVRPVLTPHGVALLLDLQHTRVERKRKLEICQHCAVASLQPNGHRQRLVTGRVSELCTVILPNFHIQIP